MYIPLTPACTSLRQRAGARGSVRERAARALPCGFDAPRSRKRPRRRAAFLPPPAGRAGPSRLRRGPGAVALPPRGRFRPPPVSAPWAGSEPAAGVRAASMSLALKARQKVRRKGGAGERVFGCDLLEHLRQSGQDVPQVLRSCTEFVEQHGVVDGIYRLSGVSSNIQRLRQEFDGERCPDLQKDVYLQDIHCVSSLCKAYFRELPNPLLTYQLYDKFADAVAIQMEEARLVKIKEVLKELPVPHYRTLEFLMRHLLLMASYSSQTNMHARNLAIVWAPNLLRSRDIEATGFNGTAAFMEVRVQSIVVEFILTHVEQLFGDAPLRGGECPRRSLLLGAGGPGAGQPPPYHVPAALSQGDGPPPIRPYHTIIELSDHRRKGSLKAKKWRSIFNLGRSSHEAKRKLAKAEEKDDKCGKISLRPAKSMDSLSSVPFSSDDAPRLSTRRSAKQPPQRQDSFDACPSPPASCPELGERPEEPPKGKEEPRGPESEGESSTKSEPTTPRAGRASLLAPGRSPKAARSRAEKCAGVHISGPFSVTVPFHITSNLSRLTRGLPCPVLAQTGREPPASPPPPARRSAGDPELRSGERRPARDPGGPGGRRADPPSPSAGAGEAEAEESRLSLELRDSFAFLDSQETWLEGGGDGGPAAWGLLPGPGDGDGDGDGFLAPEEGMESGFMNPGEPPAEHPASYLSIEECMDEEMFFMAPSGSDAEDCAGDTDSDDMFLSAHDELSPLLASPEPLGQAPGEGTAPGTPGTPAPAQPRAGGTAVPQDSSPAPGPAGPCSAEEEEEDAAGEGEHPGDPAEGPAGGWVPGGGEGAVDGGSSPSRTDSSAEAGPGDEGGGAGGAGGAAGTGPGPDTWGEEAEEDGAGSGAPAPEEPGEGEPQPSLGSAPTTPLEESAREPAEALLPETVPEVVPKVVPKPVPELVPEMLPEADPELVPEVVLEPALLPAASVEGSGASPGCSPGCPSLSASAPELCGAPPSAAVPSGAEPRGEPACPEPAAALRRDGSAPARLAARAVRVQQARSVPVVPPKPQFARVPPALQPWVPPAEPPAVEGDVPAPPRQPPGPEGSPPQRDGGGAARRAGWREGGSASFDAAVAVAAEQPPSQAPVRRIQTYGGGELAPAAPKALPFQRAPLRPRLLRPLSCSAAPEGEALGRSRRSRARLAAQAEGAARPPPWRPALGFVCRRGLLPHNMAAPAAASGHRWRRAEAPRFAV
ncbi:LOW QUALITY PROTEIN: rho GTPase-activating protein 30 [Opisthocomus hoazin]|uniref:LOW QUALITY PROTEIN: rho GTPase-activating protein 30 n=1 Tax=Opisthocomus hoazin TaxID=30419 RepID=UPI003F53068D